MARKVLFLTGTRADYGKLKPLMKAVELHKSFELVVFATGMHLLSKYGYTCREIDKENFSNVHKYINQNERDNMDIVLSKTISGLSDFVHENRPDLIVVHGDRVEALAGALVGSLNNILVAHIEGGEVSGTIDELIRHSITKMAHIHFVCNDLARKRLIQLGELEDNIFVIGSPDIDAMSSENLPSIHAVKERYEIPFETYSILLFHSVTTNIDLLQYEVDILLSAVMETDESYVVVFPNNDSGSEIIFRAYERAIYSNKRFRCFPSIRFEYFLALLKHANYIIGNSSAGIGEAPFYGTPTINIGTRQNGRAHSPSIQNVDFDIEQISNAINAISGRRFSPLSHFGDGNAELNFMKAVTGDELWAVSHQKYFVDMKNDPK